MESRQPFLFVSISLSVTFIVPISLNFLVFIFIWWITDFILPFEYFSMPVYSKNLMSIVTHHRRVSDIKACVCDASNHCTMDPWVARNNFIEGGAYKKILDSRERFTKLLKFSEPTYLNAVQYRIDYILNKCHDLFSDQFLINRTFHTNDDCFTVDFHEGPVIYDYATYVSLRRVVALNRHFISCVNCLLNYVVATLEIASGCNAYDRQDMLDDVGYYFHCFLKASPTSHSVHSHSPLSINYNLSENFNDSVREGVLMEDSDTDTSFDSDSSNYASDSDDSAHNLLDYKGTGDFWVEEQGIHLSTTAPNDINGLHLQSGQTKFLLNGLNAILDDFSSRQSRTFMSILLNSSQSRIPTLCSEIRNICFKKFRPANQGDLMSNFQKSLRAFSSINGPNAKFMEKNLFLSLEVDVKIKSISPIEHDLKVDFSSSTIDNLNQMISDFADRNAISLSRASLIVRTLWFVYDVASGQSFAISFFRFATSGFDSILAQTVITHASKLYAVLSARLHDFTEATTPDSPDVLVTQVLQNDYGTLSALSTFIHKIAGGGGSDDFVQTRIKNAPLHEFAKKLRSSKIISEYIIDLFSSAFSLLKWIFQTEEEALESLRNSLPAIAQWVETVDKLDSDFGGDTLEKRVRGEPGLAHRIFLLKTEADGWITSLSKMHGSAPFWQVFMEKYRRFLRLYDTVRKNCSNYDARKAPIVMLLCGPPGIGKSLMVRHILSTLYRVRGEKLDVDKETYMRPGTSEYWDGYTGQKVVYYNDLFQTKDLEQNKAVSMELISMAQTVPMPLNCAHLALKDNMFFSSEFVIADCNNFPTNSQLGHFISEPDALLRRFDYRISVSLKDEFSYNGKFDSTKTSRSFEYDAYKFTVKHARGEEVDLSWFDLIRFVSQRWKVHRQIQDSNITGSDCGFTDADINSLREELHLEVGERIDTTNFVQRQPNDRIVLADDQELAQRLNNVPLADDYFHVPDDTTVPRDTYTRYLGYPYTRWARLNYVATKLKSFKDYIVRSALNLHGKLTLLAIYYQLKDKYAAAIDRVRNNAFLSSANRYIRERSNFLKFSTLAKIVAASAALFFVYKVFLKQLIPSVVQEGKAYPEDSTRGNARSRARNVCLLEGSEVPVYRLLDHHHVGLPEKGRHVHSHACDVCQKEFKHQHVKRTYEESIKYPHVCAECRKKGLDPQLSGLGAAESTIHQIYKNQYNVTCRNFSINGFFIRDHLFVMPNHFFEDVDLDVDSIKLAGVHQTVTFKGSEFSNFVVDLAKDTRIILLPRKRIPAHRDITKFLQSATVPVRGIGALLVPSAYTGEGINIVRHALNDIAETSGLVWSDSVGSDIKENINNAIRYTADTQRGDCGSVLVIADKTNVPRIIGMHMAGGARAGYAGHVTSENFKRLIDKFPVELQIRGVTPSWMPELEPVPTVTGPGIPLCVDDNIHIMGCLPTSHTLFLANKTTIIESKLHETFEPKTAPAMLRPTNGIDPLRKGVTKMCRQNVDLDTEILEIATKLVSNRLLSLPSKFNTDPKILTNHEAINGVEGEPLIRAMNLATSPGWPHRVQGKGAGKSDIIKGLVPDAKMTPEFEKQVLEYEESLLNGNPIDIHFVDCLKDERRPLEKAAAGNTRVFSVGPTHFSMMMRKYTASFQAHCMANCTTSGSAVGINPHSLEWADLFLRLKGIGPNYIAGDYGKWDKWVPYQLLMAVCTIVTKFYGDEGTPAAIAREALFMQGFSAKRIAGRVLYQANGGMPSGTPGTAVFNSLANEILFAYVFEVLRREHAPAQLIAHYHRLVAFTAYGDDHIAAVSALVPWFNMINIAKVFGSMNIEYTSADKSTSVFSEAYVSEKDLTYLKRRFVVKDDFHVMAPLDIGVIQESILWSKRVNSPQTIACTISSALLEMVHHGKPKFEKFEKILEAECRANNIVMPLVSYSDTLHRIYDSGVVSIDGVSLCDPEQSLE